MAGNVRVYAGITPDITGLKWKTIAHTVLAGRVAVFTDVPFLEEGIAITAQVNGTGVVRLFKDSTDTDYYELEPAETITLNASNVRALEAQCIGADMKIKYICF